MKLICPLVLLYGVVNTGSATTCNFDFAVPGVGPSCEMKGGLPSDLIDKYRELYGGVEGLKLVVNDRKGLRKILQDSLAKVQREQQIYSGDINRIEKDLQSVKFILGTFPIGPGTDKRSKRATDPLKSLRDALNDAEMKLTNLTRNVRDNARRQSMTISASEMQIQQQDIKLQTVLQKISDLEKKAAKLPGLSQTSAVGAGVSSASFNVLWDIATISAKVQATTEIIKARVADLKERIQEIDKPMQVRNKQYQDLNNDLKHLQSGVKQLSTEIGSFQQSYTSVKRNISQEFSNSNNTITQITKQVREVEKNASTKKLEVNQKIQDLQQEKLTIQQAKTDLAQLKLNLTASLPEIKNHTADFAALKQDNLMVLGKLMSEEKAKLSKMTKDIASVNRMLTLVKAMFSRSEAKVNATQSAAAG